MYPVELDADEYDTTMADKMSIIADLRDDVVHAYGEREQEVDAELMRALERYILLQIIDDRWREHLHDMDYLREGIHLRGFAQIDPLVAYRSEEHTSELQSRQYLVCRLLLEKKKTVSRLFNEPLSR